MSLGSWFRPLSTFDRDIITTASGKAGMVDPGRVLLNGALPVKARAAKEMTLPAAMPRVRGQTLFWMKSTRSIYAAAWPVPSPDTCHLLSAERARSPCLRCLRFWLRRALKTGSQPAFSDIERCFLAYKAFLPLPATDRKPGGCWYRKSIKKDTIQK